MSDDLELVSSAYDAADKALADIWHVIENQGLTPHERFVRTGKIITAYQRGLAPRPAHPVISAGSPAGASDTPTDAQDEDLATARAMDEWTPERWWNELQLPLLHYFGTTEPALLLEVWQDQAEQADARRAAMSAASPSQPTEPVK